MANARLVSLDEPILSYSGDRVVTTRLRLRDAILPYPGCRCVEDSITTVLQNFSGSSQFLDYAEFVMPFDSAILTNTVRKVPDRVTKFLVWASERPRKHYSYIAASDPAYKPGKWQSPVKQGH